MIEERVRVLKKGPKKEGPVVYWMDRDQRASDNWALFYAQKLALEKKQPLYVCFCLDTLTASKTLRHYDFMLKGLREVFEGLKKKNIPFYLLSGKPEEKLKCFIKDTKASILVTDFNPLNSSKKQKNTVKKKLTIPFLEVDAHNIIPCWYLSQKQEYGAYTIRPKIKKCIDPFLIPIPNLLKHPFKATPAKAFDPSKALRQVKGLEKTPIAPFFQPGTSIGLKTLQIFIKSKLSKYETRRNDPNEDICSDLSPYLHFGQISAQYVAQEVKKSSAPKASIAAFLEELIVRRELSDNFCFYNKSYEKFEGFPDWAKKTLNQHRKDKREHTYSLKQFEQAKTHDALWNAAQKQMVSTGKMHGYLRMYWAKKILEWTRTPESALKIAIYLNDTYSLDGTDPNGYVGIAWSIGGVHDRAWKERPIYGKVRFMSYKGSQSKFDVDQFISD